MYQRELQRFLRYMGIQIQLECSDTCGHSRSQFDMEKNHLAKCSVNRTPLVLLRSWWQVYQLSWWQTVFFHSTKRTTCWIDANQPPILALRSYKKRPCEGCYFLPSRVWMFGYSRVFFLVCAWIFHKCTLCNVNMSIFDCMSWFFNLNIRATLHTFVLCNLLFGSKALWIELAWNAYSETTKAVVNTEEWWGDIYCEKCIVNRMFQPMQFLNAFFCWQMYMDACEEWVQGYFHLIETGNNGFVGLGSLCYD